MNMVEARSCSEIAEWFVQRHNDWIRDNKLVSWAKKLGIVLNEDGRLENNRLFHLFVLAILWNSKPTYKAEEGEKVFLRIRDKYTLKNFDEADQNELLAGELERTALDIIGNQSTYNVLRFVSHGCFGDESVWSRIMQILEDPGIGDKASDVNRLTRLFRVFNPLDGPRSYDGAAYLTVKTFLVFRELRIQFHNLGKYQYHPAICCIPDTNVREALSALRLLNDTSGDFDNMIHAREIVAEYFCNENYELYDLPLFFWNREGKPDMDTESSKSGEIDAQ
jgi:hypothetical protein